MRAKSVLVLVLLLSMGFARLAWVTVKDPSGDTRQSDGVMTANEASPCGSANADNSGSSYCSYDYAWADNTPSSHCDEEGDWTAQIKFGTRYCATSCGGDTNLGSGVFGCSAIENACQAEELSGWFTAYNINWDTDSVDCACYGGTWTDDFESGTTASCCEDDAGENYNTCADSSDQGACGADTTACCTASTDCVDENSVCRTTGACYGTSVFGNSYCSSISGSWQSPDENSAYCVASCDVTASDDGITWLDTYCCGDDSSEYSKHQDCSSGCTDDTADKTCCVINTNCVD
ncbi:MAG: hypothetical protein GOU99_01780, partial [Candidatus Altiarchaeota archaeon]|nr:hypothetical protein [Candidatus Altiarchaeota archaeon]